MGAVTGTSICRIVRRVESQGVGRHNREVSRWYRAIGRRYILRGSLGCDTGRPRNCVRFLGGCPFSEGSRRRGVVGGGEGRGERIPKR